MYKHFWLQLYALCVLPLIIVNKLDMITYWSLFFSIIVLLINMLWFTCFKKNKKHSGKCRTTSFTKLKEKKEKQIKCYFSLNAVF